MRLISKVGFVFCLVFSVSAFADYKIIMKNANVIIPEPSSEGLNNSIYSDAIRYFKMDEIQSGKLKDEISQNWIGQVQLGSASLASNSESEGAIKFVSNGNNEMFTFPLSNSELSENFTLAFKFYLISSQSYLHFLTNATDDGYNGQSKGAFKASTESLGYDVYLYSGGSGSLLSGFRLTPGRWMDIALVIDGASGVAKFYIDGVLKTIPLANFEYTNLSSAYFGFEAGWSGSFVIDEYTIFNKALSESEINSL